MATPHHTPVDVDAQDGGEVDDLRAAVEKFRAAMARSLAAPLQELNRTFSEAAVAPLETLQESMTRQLEDSLAVVQPDLSWIQDAVRAASGFDDVAKSIATSVRLPGKLHDVASRAVDLGIADSMTDLIAGGLRTNLGLLAMSAVRHHDVDDVRSALAEHYETHPDARPSLAEIVEAAAQLEDHPAANHPDLIEDAIDDLGTEAWIEDVLAWVKGALSKAAS